MSMAWVRNYYRVPAKRGGRVAYAGGGQVQLGTIRGARGGHLRIQLDGASRAMPFHPTWQLSYITGKDAS